MFSFSKTFLTAASLLILSTSANAALGTEWQSELYRACMGNTLPMGTICFEKDYTASAQLKGPYGDNLVTAKIHVEVRKPNYQSATLVYDPTFTIVEIQDANDLFAPVSNLTVYLKATALGYQNYFFNKPAVETAVNVQRLTGSRVFKNTTNTGLVVPLLSNFGAEYVETLRQVEIYFVGQEYPLTIPLL